MSYSTNESVHLRFRHTEKEYLAAIRFYFWRTKELLLGLIVTYLLFAGGVLVLQVLSDVFIPLWATIALILLVCTAWFHGYVVDRPRAYFRGDPKFREEYNLTFTDAGIAFQTHNASSTLGWSFYTGVMENDSFYLLIYGKDIHSLSILPKRAFEDREQETTFREMLHRNLDPKMKVSPGEREKPEYVPKSLEPPDWR